MDSLLHGYLRMFDNMKRSNKNGYVSPHKPILLLAIQYRIQTGWITDNRIFPDKALEQQFSQFWSVFVDNGRSQEMVVCDNFFLESEKVYPFRCKMSFPFYHLSSEPFWNLVKSENWTQQNEYSMVQLRRCFEYAEIDRSLFRLMKEEPYCFTIKDYLECLI